MLSRFNFAFRVIRDDALRIVTHMSSSRCRGDVPCRPNGPMMVLYSILAAMGAMAMAGPVTMAVLGAGARGNVFAGFAEQSPGRARVVAVADPRADRRDALADRLGVAAGRRLGDWRDLAASERLAGAGIVIPPGPAETAAGA